MDGRINLAKKQEAKEVTRLQLSEEKIEDLRRATLLKVSIRPRLI
jgi:hypothetical protein